MIHFGCIYCNPDRYCPGPPCPERLPVYGSALSSSDWGDPVYYEQEGTGKAADVRRSQKDIQIIEAHLLDIAASSRSLLRALGYSKASLGPDVTAGLSLNGKPLDSKSLFRLADNILYAVMEGSSHTDWDEAINKALNRFLEKVPSFDQEGARRIVTSVARHYTEESSRQLAFSGSGQSRKAS